MPLRTFLQAKLHRATITGAEVDYEGSVAICPTSSAPLGST